jgi:uncharacterized protein
MSEKPLPVIDAKNRPFWEGTKARELRLFRCAGCGAMRQQVLPVCPECLAEGGEWVTASGRGTVWSWGTFHKAYFPGFAAEIPYTVVIVALEEGPRVYSSLIGAAPRIGMPVEAVFEDVTDAVTLVKFRPA